MDCITDKFVENGSFKSNMMLCLESHCINTTPSINIYWAQEKLGLLNIYKINFFEEVG